MANLEDFDASQVEPSTGFDPLPAGKYIAAVVASEMKPTSQGGGQYLKLTFEVLEGPFKKRKLWANLNLKNKSAEAVAIARSELSAICRVAGILKPGDSSAIHNIPITIGVSCEKRADTGDITNKISSFAARGSSSTTDATQTDEPKKSVVGAGAPQTFNANTAAPWKK